MWLMLQQNKADDYVIATGKTTSVRDFINLCLNYLKFNYKWIGTGYNEKVIDVESKRTLIIVDKKFFRPAEVDLLIGNNSKAKRILKWKPKTSIEKLVKIMIDYDLSNI
jgi:GDPmannose 4,6-dehydratase